MKTLFKLLLVASVLIPLNTTHAFWGDDGDTYVSVTTFAGKGATTTFETQLKNIKSAKFDDGRYVIYGSKNYYSFIGWIASSKDIEKVKKYLKKK